MANNCFISKYLGSVNNDTLPKFNTLVLHLRSLVTIADASRQSFLQVRISKNSTISVVGGKTKGYFSSNVSDLSNPEDCIDNASIPANTTIGFYFSNSDFDIEISDKDKIIELSTLPTDNQQGRFYLDTSDLKYLSSLRVFKLINNELNAGDIANIKDLPLTDLNIRKASISGSTESMKSLTSLQKCDLYYSLINGDFKDLAESTSLTYLNITSNGTLTGQITGKIEEFVARQVAKGRTSKATGDGIDIRGASNKVSFYGKMITSAIIGVYWDTVGKIWLAISNKNTSSASEIWCYNCTTEEISAWKTAGKTVWAYENSEWVEK